MTGVARLVMMLAARSLPHDARAWGQAMEAEFDEAVREGNALGFAAGCLATAWRRLPMHGEGRQALAGHAVTLGLIVPIATFHLGCAVSGARVMLTGHDPYRAVLATSGPAGPALADAYGAAIPAMAALLLLLGLAHLLIGWVILDRRWRRAAMLWLVAAAVAATLVGVIVTTVPSGRGIAIQLAALVVELAAIPALALWHKARARSPHLTEA